MGKVTEEIIGLISKQVDDHGIVVWYDPNKTYYALANELSLPDVRILTYSGSFFDLRSKLEPFLEFVDESGRFHGNLESPPKVLMYVPEEREKTHHALVEAEAAGVFMAPGASPWQRNTRLKVIAERIFKKIAPDRASKIASNVESGHLNLDELDRLAEQSEKYSVLKLIFDATSVSDIVLKFLNSMQYDKSIVSKGALEELYNLVQDELGMEVRNEQSLDQFRNMLSSFLLLAEFAIKVEGGGGDVSKIANVPLPEKEHQRKLLLEICDKWRKHLDLRESYIDLASKVERDSHMQKIDLDIDHLKDVHTFRFVEFRLLKWAESELLKGNKSDVHEFAGRRKTSFWPSCEGEFQIRWTLLEIASRLLMNIERVEVELKEITDVEALIEAYTKGKVSHGDEQSLPWFKIDQWQRHLEYQYAKLSIIMDSEGDDLEKVIGLVRRRYGEIVARSAEALAQSLKSSEFRLSKMLRQNEVFCEYVFPRKDKGKTAYILVDALRYEMGCELIDGLGSEFDVKLMPALAQVPTITEVGMAALMPGSEKSMELVEAGTGLVGIKIDSNVLKNRDSRIKYWKDACGSNVVLKINELVKPSRKTHKSIAAADIILVTSREIDFWGEEGENEEDARRFMDEVLEKIRRGIRRLAGMGVKYIVVSADHGFVFLEQLEGAMKLDAPGGRKVDLHPRVWIGRGGSDHPNCLRFKAAQIGLGGDLELVFPVGLACFKTPGRTRGYLHGGLSLQELIIPVATITIRKPLDEKSKAASLVLKMAKPRITNRFFSVEVCYNKAELFGDKHKRIKMVVRSGGSDVGSAAMAAYGFEEGTQEIVLEEGKPNAITMMINIDSGIVSLYALDAEMQVELVSTKDIPVEILI